MKSQYKRKPRKCPKCGNKTISTILYGMPVLSDKLVKDLDKGIIVLGGCCIDDNDPSWKCTKCDTVLNELKGEILKISAGVESD